MKRTSLLDRVKVPAPCPADWGEMRGNERVRFCQHCQLNVHNLSAMTRPEAEKIVRRARGRICVRYYHRPDGAVLTAEPLVQIQAGLRRASRLAAGAFSAALSLCATAAAQEARPRERADPARTAAQTVRAAQSDRKDAGGYGSINGTVIDPNGAVVANAVVTLLDTQYGDETMKSDDEGQFRFSVQAGVNYRIKVEAEGFKDTLLLDVSAAVGQEAQVKALVEPAGETVTVGGAMVVSPEEPLLIAVQKGELLTVQGLLATGSDVNVLDKGVDKTALMEAVATNNLELVHVLLGAGAQVNARNEYGQTALMELGDEATPELVRALVTAGARLNLKDRDGDTALMNVARWGNAETLRALVAAGAKVNAHNNGGETALMLAAADGELEKVKVLLAAGADVNRRDKDGHTALKQAQENEHADVVDMLLAYGASVEPETKDVP